jgi:stress-induced morphogen
MGRREALTVSITILRKPDRYINQIKRALRGYEAAHPSAQIVLYRENSASVSIRVIDPDFADMDRVDRHDLVWTVLEKLDQKVLGHITILLPLTPDEASNSLLSKTFDDVARPRSRRQTTK